MSVSSHALSGNAAIPARLAQISFFATLVLIPIRLRFDLLSRPELRGQKDYTDFLLFAPDIAILATLAFWGLSLLIARRRIRLGPVYLWLPLAGLSLAGLASSAASVDRALSLYHAVRLAALFLFFLYVVNEIARPALVLYGVALQGVLQALVAVAQFLSQRSVGLQRLGEYVLDPAAPGTSIVSIGSQRILRAYGLSDHPNILGGCLAFGMVLLLAVYLWTDGRTRLAALIAFLPMSLALLLTFSRSAWLAFAAGAAFLVAMQVALRRREALRPLLWLAVATAAVLLPFARQERAPLGIRLNAGGSFDTVGAEQQSIGERALLVRAAGQLFATHAWTGVGLGAAPIAMKNQNPASTLAAQPPHMALLEAALETGLPGAAFYLLLLVLPWLMLLRRSGMLAQPQVAGAAALLLAVTVAGFFDYYTWLLVPGRLWQWLAWGLLAASVQSAGYGAGAHPSLSALYRKDLSMLSAVNLQTARPETILFKRAILHTLSYADVFDYPLTLSEIHRYLSFQPARIQDVALALDDLVESGAVVRVGEWFMLPGRAAIAGTRARRARIAAQLWRQALRYGRILASLPFVRMVAVTGSLAMYNTEQGKDIDFMLVSTPGRLWTTRALAILVTRLAALEGVTLCPNYIVTTDALEFHEQSLYVAHEVAQMIPLSGSQVYGMIRDFNVWTEDFLPNAQDAPAPLAAGRHTSRWQRLMEAALGLLPVQWFEAWEMRRKVRKLSRQQSASPEAYFSAQVCKGHIDRHGRRTETLLRQRLASL